MHQLPAGESMTPYPDEQVGIILGRPVYRPICRRFQAVDRDAVVFDVANALEVLNDRFELVISGCDGLGIDTSDVLVGEKYRLLSQGRAEGIAAFLQIPHVCLVLGYLCFSLADDVLAGLDHHDPVLALELGVLDLESARPTVSLTIGS